MSSESSFECEYMSGFGNEFSTEAIPNSLPKGQNNPQQCPFGLYAEQLSGTAFTAPRAKNRRTWLYRIRPSVADNQFADYPHAGLSQGSTSTLHASPNQHRWMPQEFPASASATDGADFVDGLTLMSGAGEAGSTGLAIYTYLATKGMGHRAMYNSDGDMLIVPQAGVLRIKTEMGLIVAEPCEIVVIQRGIKFSIDIDSPARGYVLEVFGGHFTLPDLGPIGANGLANARDFLTPRACFEDTEEQDYSLVNKFSGEWFVSSGNHSPFNVVAWHGNYAPYKYDLRKFCCMNSVTYDHPDPSIYTVLTCASAEPGTALADFVIFPPRWMVMEGTFRPPYFHRNCMSEYMGMVYGEYDAKAGGFVPGGSSLHVSMTAHGPDAGTFEKASDDSKPQVPVKFDGGLAFMFETCCTLKVSATALQSPLRDSAYADCWKNLPKKFVPPDHSEGGPIARTFQQLGL